MEEQQPLVELPCKPSSSRKRPFFSLYNLFLLGFTCGMTFLAYVLVTALQGATNADVREIDSILKGFSVSGQAERQRLKEIKASLVAGDAPAPRILVVGMAESLQVLQENDPVISALSSLCWVYSGEDADSASVDVRILYRGTKMEYDPHGSNDSNNGNDMDDDERVLTIQGLLSQWGCRVVLEQEEIVWEGLEGEARVKAMEEFQQLSRYKRLAKLRSFHRQHILSSPDAPQYGAVVNVDMDVVQLPPILAMLSSIDRMVSDADNEAGNVVCANGFETWAFPFGYKRQMYYDTLAAIEEDGAWAYHKMSTSVSGIIKFAQNTLLRDILRQKDGLWRMQSCFGGVAMYDFDTWATPDCDYDESRIKFVPPFAGSDDAPSRQLRTVPSHAMASQLHRQRWTLDPQYTLSGTPGGDACEHVTFQKCLRDHNRAQAKRTLQIGIQPDLVIQREAAVLGRAEDVFRVLWHLSGFLGGPILSVTLLALSLFPLWKYVKSTYFGHYAASSKSPRIKKHDHDA